MSVKKSLRDATLTNSKYSFTRNFTVGSPLFRANTGWERNPAWLPMPGFNYVNDAPAGFTFLGTTIYDFALQSDGKIIVGAAGGRTSLRYNEDLTVDSSFSLSQGVNDIIRSISIQPDGKILFGGDFTSVNGATSNYIVRLTSTGSTDTSFNIGTGFDNSVQKIIVLSNGKILVGGSFTTYNGTTCNGIIRLNSDGSIDTSFNIGSGFNNIVRDMKILSDGKILVGGYFTSYNGSTNLDRRITRLNSDGSVDRTFVTNSGSNAGFNNPVEKIEVQSNGKIVVGGLFTQWQNTTTVNYIARLNSDGSLDQTFNIGTGFNDWVLGLKVATDDYIYVGGLFTTFNGTSRTRIARLNPDGSYDTNFDTGTGFNDSVRGFLIQPSGKILIGGAFTTYRGVSGTGNVRRLTVTEEKIIILQGIKNTANSEVTEFSCAANYTVNWGDGNIINYARDTIASHTYNYFDANLDNTNGNVSFLDSGDWVVRSNHGYANTNTISFANISTTTGITVDTPYYVINANTNYFNLSNTVGGSAVTLTTDGSGFILPYKQVLINVYPRSGNTLTSINLGNTNSTVYTSGYSSMFLDIGISAANVTTLSFGTTKRQNTIERVAIFNSNSITNTDLLFSGLQALQSVPLFDTSKVTTMNNMFEFCRSLQVVPLLNTANVTSMVTMFYQCSSLQTVPLFDTAKVTSMSSMFNLCSSLKTVPQFNTANVTNMTGMFTSCYSLQTVPLFNTAKVTSMLAMFEGSYSLESVPQFNTSNVTTMQQMFIDCSSLKTVPLFNTANVVSMYNMFVRCYTLQSVPLFNTAKVTDMTGMFQLCYSLNSVPLFNTANVTGMSYMFYVCRNLKTVPQFNTAAVTNMSGMFRDCAELVSVPEFNTAAATDMQQMFLGCYSLKSVPLFNTANVTNMDLMFYLCYSLQSVPPFNTAKVTTMGQMFLTCRSLNSVPQFNTAAVTKMPLMFFNCYSLKSVPEFNTAKVTDMTNMFYGCNSLQSVPKFNTANVISMTYMFQSCYSLQSVPEFNTAKVTNMEGMFSTCYSLESVPQFNTANVTNMSSMFGGCYSLKEVPALNANSVTNFTDMFVSARLTRSQLANVRYTHSYLNNNLANVELNEIYTNLPTVTSQTITVTGNWGTASDDPTIATAKGWTVTG